MTAKEAIKVIKRRSECERRLKTTYAALVGKDSKAYKESVDYLEADWLAIYALRKVIPEKVNGEKGYYTCKCGAIVPPMERYCQDCGQRLKWRDEG